VPGSLWGAIVLEIVPTFDMATTVEFLAAVAYIERQVAANELAQVRLIAPCTFSCFTGRAALRQDPHAKSDSDDATPSDSFLRCAPSWHAAPRPSLLSATNI